MVAFFDTNILVYLADNRDARKQSIALELVKAALAKRIGIVAKLGMACPMTMWAGRPRPAPRKSWPCIPRQGEDALATETSAVSQYSSSPTLRQFQRIDAWISVQALTEFTNVALGKLKLPPAAVGGLLDFFEQLQVVGIRASFARRGMEIRERYGLQYYDSVMLAAAEQMGATIFYTEDLNDGQVYAGVKAVNPFAKSV